jgi:hypothetical protein
MNGKQGGDPAKLASALVHLISLDDPPRRFVAGADAVAAVTEKPNTLRAQANAFRELSGDLSFDEP